MPYTDQKMQDAIDKHTKGLSEREINIVEMLLDDVMFRAQDEMSDILRSIKESPFDIPKYVIPVLEISKEIVYILDEEIKNLRKDHNEDPSLN